MFPLYRPAMPDERPLNPPTLSIYNTRSPHAPLFDGRKAFKLPGETMAKITAAYLAACLSRSGFVVIRKPAAVPHSSRPKHPSA